jgi:hypothetical protein
MRYLKLQGTTGRNRGRSAVCPRGWDIAPNAHGFSLPISTVP